MKSAINSGFADDPQAIWSRLAAGCEAAAVAGNHTSMVSRHFVEFGAVLSRYMEEAIQSGDLSWRPHEEYFAENG